MMPEGGDMSAILIYVNGQENTTKKRKDRLKLDLQPPTIRCQPPVTSVLNPVKAFLPSRPCAHPAHTVPVALSGKNEEEKKKPKTTMKGKKTQTGRHATRSRVGFSEHLENMAAGWETTSRHTPAAMWQRRRRRLVGPVLQAEGSVWGGPSLAGPPPPQRF